MFFSISFTVVSTLTAFWCKHCKILIKLKVFCLNIC